MKIFLLSLAFSTATALQAQTDTVTANVYHWASSKTQQSNGRESRNILTGGTRDLARLGIHASILAPGSVNHPPAAYKDREELIIVKQGQLKATINGVTKLLNAGGLALIIAGDEQSFQNASTEPIMTGLSASLKK